MYPCAFRPRAFSSVYHDVYTPVVVVIGLSFGEPVLLSLLNTLFGFESARSARIVI